MRITTLVQAFRGSARKCRRRLAVTVTASAFITYNTYATSLAFSSPPTYDSQLLTYLLYIFWPIPYFLLYIAPYLWLIVTYLIYTFTNPSDLFRDSIVLSKILGRQSQLRHSQAAELQRVQKEYNRLIKALEELDKKSALADETRDRALQEQVARERLELEQAGIVYTKAMHAALEPMRQRDTSRWFRQPLINLPLYNPEDVPISKAKGGRRRLYTAEECNNRVVWCFENLFPTIFLLVLEWNVWMALNSPWRELKLFDVSAAWLGGTGSDGLYWLFTLFWTLVLALFGISVMVCSCTVWTCVLGDALDVVADEGWLELEAGKRI